MPSDYDKEVKKIDDHFMSTVSELAEKYGCVLVAGDFIERWLDIDGPERAKEEMEAELDEVLQQWAYKRGQIEGQWAM